MNLRIIKDTKHILKHRKQDIFVILLALVLINIILTIISLYFLQDKKSTPQQTTTNIPTPTSVYEENNNYTFKYNTEAHSKLADIIINRPPLSLQDQEAKTNLLQTTVKGFNSGIVYETPNVRVEYVQSVDMFLAEILTDEVQTAKNETNIWFRERGLTQKGICNLPVMFYFDRSKIESLQNKDMEFNPLPNSCL